MANQRMKEGRQMTGEAPTVLVFFGVTGDLVRKKIAPALFRLYDRGELPAQLSVVGFARRPLSDEELREHIKNSVRERIADVNMQQLNEFVSRFSYSQGNFENLADYTRLAELLGRTDEEWRTCANKLFYLASSPEHYMDIADNLAASGLTVPCGPDEGWTRVAVEKPFGKNRDAAHEFELRLEELFEEEQIFRVDHYPAKEILQMIVPFRFRNNLLEPMWSNHHIERIDIRLWEEVGVEDRGNFYDGVGALRDVGQNHLLQMLALVTMEDPGSFDAEAIRQSRTRVLQQLRTPSEHDIEHFTFRAQYEGYQSIPNVREGSPTETYFRTRAFLDAPRWQGVPIYLQSGKRMGGSRKEIAVTFKARTRGPSGEEHPQNVVVFRIEPNEAIEISVTSRRVGTTSEVEQRALGYAPRESREVPQYVEEYSRLLRDMILGDQTLFVTSEEAEAMWRYVQPILEGWERGAAPLQHYAPDSAEIAERAAFSERASSLDAKQEIGIIGLGKMGANIAARLSEGGWHVVGFDRAVTEPQPQDTFGRTGSLKELVEALPAPRTIWLMVPAGSATGETIEALLPHLERGDTIIDGGNSFYKDAVTRSKMLAARGVHFVDVGVSGGPDGARYGASLMIGGSRENFDKLEPLFVDLAQGNGYQFFEGAGAGHFVKMVHNGIEYGMMQSIAEGFDLLHAVENYSLDLRRVAHVYNHGSVVESRLMEWLQDAFDQHGPDLNDVSGVVGHTGEGAWTVETARKLKVKVEAIEAALKFRINSVRTPDSFTGRVVSALREQFGGHSVQKK